MQEHRASRNQGAEVAWVWSLDAVTSQHECLMVGTGRAGGSQDSDHAARLTAEAQALAQRTPALVQELKKYREGVKQLTLHSLSAAMDKGVSSGKVGALASKTAKLSKQVESLEESMAEWLASWSALANARTKGEKESPSQEAQAASQPKIADMDLGGAHMSSYGQRTFPHGKHAGKTYDHVLSHDPNYHQFLGNAKDSSYKNFLTYRLWKLQQQATQQANSVSSLNQVVCCAAESGAGVLSFIVDSGADIHIMPDALATDWGFKRLERKPLNAVDAGGNDLQVTGVVQVVAKVQKSGGGWMPLQLEVVTARRVTKPLLSACLLTKLGFEVTFGPTECHISRDDRKVLRRSQGPRKLLDIRPQA